MAAIFHLRGCPRTRPRAGEPLAEHGWRRGPSDGLLTADVDSTICEVDGHHKQGAGHGYNRRLGLHPCGLPRTAARRCTPGCARSAKTARGIVRFVDELIAAWTRTRQRRLTMRMDWILVGEAHRSVRAHRGRDSITVRQTETVRAAITSITEADRSHRPHRRRLAQVAEPLIAANGSSCAASATSATIQLFATRRDHAF